MGSRAFDPALLGIVDGGWFPDEETLEDVSFATPCPKCGEEDLVLNEELILIDLDGKPHRCPAA